MPVIESYSFGRMVIDGTTYTRDLIILPDNRIFSPWWRKEGHRLFAEDLAELLAIRPATIIAGTGASGMMRPDPGLVQLLTGKGTQWIALPTAEAVEEYNRLSGTGKIGACFHLTC